MLLEVVSPSNGLVSTSLASSTSSRALVCLRSRARSSCGVGLAWSTASTLFCCAVEPAFACSSENSRKLTTTIAVQIVDASSSSRCITRPQSGARLRYARPMTSTSANVGARERLLAALREHALVIGEVTLTSGRTAQYYVDAKRAILLPDALMALGALVAEQARA